LADPAPGRLGLGGPAMRTTPHRHARMVAAIGGAVDRPEPNGRPEPRARRFLAYTTVVRGIRWSRAPAGRILG
jgi:hypothetical protein